MSTEVTTYQIAELPEGVTEHPYKTFARKQGLIPTPKVATYTRQAGTEHPARTMLRNFEQQIAYLPEGETEFRYQTLLRQSR